MQIAAVGQSGSRPHMVVIETGADGGSESVARGLRNPVGSFVSAQGLSRASFKEPSVQLTLI